MLHIARESVKNHPFQAFFVFKNFGGRGVKALTDAFAKNASFFYVLPICNVYTVQGGYKIDGEDT